jgi:hypothetical protein
MERLSEFWHWVERVTGVFLLFTLSLYGLRCVMTGQFTSFDEFERFFRGLVRYIFG